MPGNAQIPPLSKGLRAVAALMACLGLCVSLGACGNKKGEKPDFLDLETAPVSSFANKSSPRAFVGVFREICIQNAQTGSPVGPKLDSMGYRAHAAKAQNPRFYLAKNKLPVLILSAERGKSGCAVAGNTTNGHTYQAKNLIQKAYPDAIPIDQSQMDNRIETAWRIPSQPGILVFMARDTPLGAPSTLTLGIVRSP